MTTKFVGVLAEPIVVPLHPPTTPDGLIVVGENMPAFFERIVALAEHYGIKTSEPEWSLSLALSLAKDFVPGFQFVYDDPLAARLGLPMKGGKKAGRAGTGLDPAIWGPRLIAMVNLAMRIPGVETEKAACQRIAASFFPKLRGKAVEGKAETIRKRLTEAKRRERTSKAK